MKQGNITYTINYHNQTNIMQIETDWLLYKLIHFNIIYNAVKYNKENGKITVITSLEYENDEPFLITYIQDTGCGIDEHRLAYMFKEFSELQNRDSLA